MQIVIMTYGRHKNQKTFHNLPPEWQARTQLVVQEREKDLYKAYDTIVLPDHIRDLPSSRQWLLENLQTEDNKLLMLDDDLQFFVRENGPGKLVKCTEADFIQMFETIEDRLDRYALVGVSQREGNNRQQKEEVEVTRCGGMFGIRLDRGRENNWRFDRTKTKEDMDYILQMLSQGCKNLVLFTWCREAGVSNAAGGCSVYRTDGVMKEDALHFAALWPGVVKVIEKQTKTSWGGGSRYDVIVQWKKCYGRT